MQTNTADRLQNLDVMPPGYSKTDEARATQLSKKARSHGVDGKRDRFG